MSQVVYLQQCSRPLHPKDLINIDITIYHSSHHGDTSATFALPECDKPGRDLVDATREALYEGIKVCKPGAQFKEIGKAIRYMGDTWERHTLIFGLKCIRKHAWVQCE